MAYDEIRTRIVDLRLPPQSVLRDEALQAELQLGRTPIREALQRLVRDQFVTVLPRRGAYVSAVDVDELPLLYDTRSMLEPYAMRLACMRGTEHHWAAMDQALRPGNGKTPEQLLAIDRRCREVVWDAAGNRFITATLDMLYAHSSRLWHLYVLDVENLSAMLDEHRATLAALRRGDAATAESLIVAHMRSFNESIQRAVTRTSQRSR